MKSTEINFPSTNRALFEGRTISFATMHEKEKLVAPLLHTEFGLKTIVPDSFDTDRFGTFTGEVDRQAAPLATLRKKCLAGMEACKTDIGMASEGSFGPHPIFFLAPCDEEFMIFIDKKNKLEIVVKELSTATNFNKRSVHSWQELSHFAKGVGFPSHAIILSKNIRPFEGVKGIQTWEGLEIAFNALSSNGETVTAETDMRAHLNPSRVRVILQVFEKLIAALNANCPGCNAVGFIQKKAILGMPCSLCLQPTQVTKAYETLCTHCDFIRVDEAPNGMRFIDPTYCNHCNP